MSDWSVSNSKHAATTKAINNKEINGTQNASNGNTFHGKHKISDSNVNIKQTGKHNQTKLDKSFGNSGSINQTSTSNYGRNIADVKGDDNSFAITQKGGVGHARVVGDKNSVDLDATGTRKFTGVFKGNDFLSEHLNLSETGKNKLLVDGENFTIGEVTGGEDADNLIFSGSGDIENIDTKEGDDKVTLSAKDNEDGITVGDVDLGDGDDLVRANGVTGKLTGGDGEDTAHIRETSEAGNDIELSEFEKVMLETKGELFKDFDWDNATELPAGAEFIHDEDGKGRQLKIGDNIYKFDDSMEGDLDIDGTSKSYSDWWSKFGAEGTTDPDDPTTGDVIAQDDIEGPITGANEVTVNDAKLDDIDLKQGDDTLFDIDKDASGKANGGAGNDIAKFLNNVEDYTITGNATDGFTFKHNDSAEELLLSNFEGYDFNGTSLDNTSILNHIAPTFNDDANSYTAQENATSAHSSINLAGGDDTFVVGANGLAGYSAISGGAGNDILDMTAITDKNALKNLFSATQSGSGYTNPTLGGGALDGFENFNTGIDDGSGNGTNFSFTDIQQFLQWLFQ